MGGLSNFQNQSVVICNWFEVLETKEEENKNSENIQEASISYTSSKP